MHNLIRILMILSRQSPLQVSTATTMQLNKVEPKAHYDDSSCYRYTDHVWLWSTAYSQLESAVCWFSPGGGGGGEPGEKPLGQSRGPTETQPTYAVGSRNQTWATLVGGELSPLCQTWSTQIEWLELTVRVLVIFFIRSLKDPSILVLVWWKLAAILLTVDIHLLVFMHQIELRL